MSELGLRFDETPYRTGRHRHRRKPAKQGKKGRGGRSFMALLMVVLLLGGLGYGGWWGLNWVQDSLTTAADYAGEGVGAVTVEIRPGHTASDIAQVLYEADVVASPQAFVDAARANPLSVNIQPGFYEIPQQLPAATAVELLLDLTNRQVERVTIPEGLSKFRTFALLSEELDIPVEEFEEAAADPIALGVPDWWFNRNDDREAAGTIEGFLFPSTYEFPPDPTAEQVLETMVGQFLSVAEELNFVDRVESELNILPYEALIVASLSEAEAGVDADLPKVARVTYNRLYRPTPELACACLQFDVTTNYWLETLGEEAIHSGEMSHALMTDPDNDYNTTTQPGLTPGPINSPGRAALEAAIEPATGDWYFFVALTDGGESAFAETNAEHEANIRQACENGVPVC